MYHFDNGYDAEVECIVVDGKTVCSITVTGNNTVVKLVKLTSSEVAENLIKIRDQRPS